MSASTRHTINYYYDCLTCYAKGSFYEDFEPYCKLMQSEPYKIRKYVLSCVWHRLNRWPLDNRGFDKLDGYNTQMFVLDKAIQYLMRKKCNQRDRLFCYNWIRSTMPWLEQYGE